MKLPKINVRQLRSKLPTGLVKFGYSVKRNLPTILSVAGCIGVPLTAVLSSRATLKAKEILDQQPDDTTFMEDVKAVSKYYILPTITGLATMGSIVGANSINLKRNAALAASGAALAEYIVNFRNKVEEEHGKEALMDIDRKIAEEQIAKRMQDDDFPKELDDDEFFVWEPYTETLFVTKKDWLQKAEIWLNKDLQRLGSVSVNEFIIAASNDLATPFELNTLGDYIGWDKDSPIQSELWLGWNGYEWVEWNFVDTKKDFGMVKEIIFCTEPLPFYKDLDREAVTKEYGKEWCEEYRDTINNM